MSKVIMEFDSIEDKDEIDMALNGWKFKSILYNIYELNLRGKIKHGLGNNNIPLTDEQIKVYVEIEELILSELDNYDLTVESLYK